jgi:hypothetical protein
MAASTRKPSNLHAKVLGSGTGVETAGAVSTAMLTRLGPRALVSIGATEVGSYSPVSVSGSCVRSYVSSSSFSERWLSAYAAEQFLALVRGELHLHCLYDSSFRPSRTKIERQIDAGVDCFMARYGAPSTSTI